MKMKTWMAIAGLAVWGTFAAPAGDSLWTDNFEEAKARAKAENRFMVLDFTGSDWCGWCIKLDKEVFSKSDFQNYAQEKLVCVVVDFPRKKLSGNVAKQNEELAKQFGIRGYPSIIVLDPNGEKIGQTGYKEGGPKAYVEHLEEIIKPHASKFGAASAGAAGGGGEKKAAMEAVALRTWTSSTGSTIEARYYRMIGSQVELRKANGASLRIDVASLSAADQDFLRAIKAIK
mgnify:CR=1 FL=1